MYYRSKPPVLIVLAFCVLGLLSPLPARAHAFGQSYTLPVPTWLFIYGGAAAVVVSFLVIAAFMQTQHGKLTPRLSDITDTPLLRFFHHRLWRRFIQWLMVAFWFLMLAAGFFGNQEATLNFAPTSFWIIFLLGMTYLTAITGNIWSWVNPLKTLAHILYRKTFSGRLTYPKRWGYYPALLFYILLIAHELFIGPNPFLLASVSFSYALITFWGIYLFGEDTWLAHGDIFTVYFDLISRLAPVVKKKSRTYLRAPLMGLLDLKPSHLSLLLFILFMLSSTAFDGFRETTKWTAIIMAAYPLYTFGGHDFYIATEIILLLASLGIFFVLYLAVIALIQRIMRSKVSVRALALTFAPSLIPIAFVYNVAHYFMLFIVQGQAIIPLISDPFGRGWNLFATSAFGINPSPINAAVVWYLQVGLIIAGHIASVYIAHVQAQALWSTGRQAIVSQLPMLILMVFYTGLGLWILSQPFAIGQ